MGPGPTTVLLAPFLSSPADLNYENPEVRDAMISVVRHWLDLGIDGFRLDAAAYLYQRDGTTGENLPETHAFLQRIRKEIDRDYPNRVLLAEVNQWPSDVVDYFGDGDECHMCFTFPSCRACLWRFDESSDFQ